MATYTTADYRPDDPTWRASHGYPPLAPAVTGFEIPSPMGVPEASAPPILPNYQANTDIWHGWGGSVLNKLAHPEVLEDVSRGAWGGNYLQPQIVADLNRRVASGAITQEQANAEWARMREAEAEAARGRETSNRQFQQRGLATIGSIAAGGYLGGLAGGEAAGGIGEGSASTAATGVAPAATQGFVGSDVAAAGIGGEAPITDFFGNTGVDEFGNPTQSNFQGGPGTPGSSDFFNPGGTPGGLPGAPPGATTIPPGTQSALERVFGKGIMAAIGNNPAVAAALAAGVLEKSNNPLTQPTIDAIKGAIASGQSIQGMQIPGITPSLQRAIDTANTNVGAWKPALDEAGAFTRSGGAPITAEDTARYMNPYIDQALAPAARKVSEAAAAQRMSDAAKAGSRGAFGTERNDQIAGLNKRNELMSLGDVYGTGYANAFNTALNTAGADKSRALSAGGAFGNLATTTSALGGKDIEGLTSAGGIESLPFTEELTKQKTAGDVLSGAGNAGARAIGSTGKPSLLTNLTGAAGVLGAFDKLGGSTPSVPSLPSIPGIGSPAATPSLPAPSNNPFDDSNAGVFGS